MTRIGLTTLFAMGKSLPESNPPASKPADTETQKKTTKLVAEKLETIPENQSVSFSKGVAKPISKKQEFFTRVWTEIYQNGSSSLINRICQSVRFFFEYTLYYSLFKSNDSRFDNEFDKIIEKKREREEKIAKSAEKQKPAVEETNGAPVMMGSVQVVVENTDKKSKVDPTKSVWYSLRNLGNLGNLETKPTQKKFTKSNNVAI